MQISLFYFNKYLDNKKNNTKENRDNTWDVKVLRSCLRVCKTFFGKANEKKSEKVYVTLKNSKNKKA